MLGKIKAKIVNLMKGGFFHIFFGNTMIKMIAFVSSIVIVRLVDKTEYAYLSYADNLYHYVTAFAGLGMASAILKYCATAENRGKDKAYFLFAIKYGTLFESLLSLVIVLYVTYATIPFPKAKVITYVLVLYPAMNNIITTVLSYLRAHGENKIYSRAAVVQTFLVFIGSALLVLIMGINGIAIARYIAITVAVISCVKVLHKHMGQEKAEKLSGPEIKTFMIMSVSLMISNLFSLIMPINEMTLVSELIRDEVVTANYKIAIMIPAQLSFVTQSIVVYYFTIIAKQKDGKEIWKLTQKVGLLTAGIVGIIAVIGATTSPFVIRLVYGSQYEDAIGLSAVFWIVYALNSAIRMVPMNFLPAIGVAKFNAVMAAVSCGAHWVLTYWAISNYGILGAGIATGIVYLGSGLMYWLYFRRQCFKIKGNE